MKIIFLGLFFGIAAWGAGKGQCTRNIPIKWDVQPMFVDGSTLTAIYGDSLLPYENGVDGVQTVVDVCGGTGDAKLVLNFSTRNLWVSFANKLYETSMTPTAMKNGETVGCMNICWMFIVRNLVYVPSVPAGLDSSDEYEFTTHLNSGGPLNSHVVMLNPNVDAVPASSEANANIPTPNSKVRVVHCPKDFVGTSTTGKCAAGRNEQWFVWPEGVDQVASILVDAKRTKANGGEFKIPFYFVITALQ